MKRIALTTWTLAMLLMLAGCRMSAYSQGVSFQANITNPISIQGTKVLAPLGSASVYVCAAGNTVCDGTNPVTVYSNSSLSVVMSQPIAADANGYISFYAAPGQFKYSIYGVNGFKGTYPVTIGGSGGSSLPVNTPFVGGNSAGQAVASPYTPVNKAGDTMTGTLTLAGDPAAAMAAATKQYVDNHSGSPIPSGTGVVRQSGTTTSVAPISAAEINALGTLSNTTTGTASNLSGTPALPNGTTATTQVTSDSTTKLATDAFVQAVKATIPAGASFPATNGLVYNTTTQASRNATVSDISALANCITNGYAPVMADGSVSGCANDVNSYFDVAISSSSTDVIPLPAVNHIRYTVQGGFPVSINSAGTITPLTPSTNYAAQTSFSFNGVPLILCNGSNSNCATSYNNRGYVGFSSGAGAGGGAAQLQGLNRSVCISSSTSIMVADGGQQGCFDLATRRFYLGNSASTAATAGWWAHPSGTMRFSGMNAGISSMKTANYTVIGTDFTVPIDATSGTRTVTTETAPEVGHVITVKKMDASANTVSITGPSGAGVTFDGAATLTISAQYSFYTIQAVSATVWYVIGKG